MFMESISKDYTNESLKNKAYKQSMAVFKKYTKMRNIVLSNRNIEGLNVFSKVIKDNEKVNPKHIPFYVSVIRKSN